MKKIIITLSIFLSLLLVTAVSMANMNVVNLLVEGRGLGGGSGGDTSSIWGDNGTGDAGLENDESQYNLDGINGLQETLQSGLINHGDGQANGGAINLLWALQNAKDVDKSSYAYQLLEVYSKLQQGEYNNLEYHISPEAIAGSHVNESKLSSFVTPNAKLYGKSGTGSILGKEINGKILTLENAMKSDIVGNSPRSGSVWADKDSRGGDGCPDGPFQIIQCKPSGGNSNQHANKQRTDKTYDLYNFVDSANVKDYKYNNIAKNYAETGLTPDPRALSMLSALDHNRGSAGVGWVLFGFPYDVSTSKSGGSGKYLKRQTISKMTPQDLVVAAEFPKNLLKWFDASNIPLEDMKADNATGQAVGMLLTLANGGFIDIPLQKTSASNLKKLKDSTIQKVFPGQTNKTIVDHINSNFVKQPWSVLGMSKAEYDKIYGSGPYSNYEEGYSTPNGYYRNTVFHIDESIKSDNYKAGENIVVRAMEGIALGYLLDVGVAGPATITNIALEAGITSLKDETVIDPSNPQAIYKSNGSGVYNPAGAASGNYGKFLDALGLTGTLSVTQQAQIEAMYEYSGGPYSQSSRGKQTKDGRYYMDCSLFTSVGLHMGLGKQTWAPNPQTSNIKSGSWLKSKNQTLPVDGKTYPAKVVQLDKNGNPMAENSKMDLKQSRRDIEWLDYVQAGDIINGVRPSGSGHVFTYLGKNNTKQNIVLTQDISKVNPGASVFKPGEHFTIQAYYTANRDYAGGTGAENSGRMGLTKLWYDTQKPGYQAMRPVYNLEK